MNNRDYKSFAEGEYYHIYNRGVGKMDIFKDDQDYSNFLKRLKITLSLEKSESNQTQNSRKKPNLLKGRASQIRSLPENSFSIICYCLMPNHFHLLIKQNTKIPVTDLIKKLCTSYSMYFNRKYKRVGSLFQGIFKSVNVKDNSYLLWLSAYIHQNPTVAGLVWDLMRWKWSSYLDFITNEKDELCKKDIIIGQFNTKGAYQKFVESSLEALKRNKDLEPYFLEITEDHP